MSTDSLLITVLLGLVPLIAILVGGAGWLIRHERERREAIESQLSEKKYTAYMALIDIFFNMLKAGKAGQIPSTDLTVKMMDANKNLLIYGSDEVFLTYQELTRSPGEGQKAMLHKFGNVILAIRRDMGHPKTKLSSDTVLRSFITDFDEMRQKDLI